jgi:hypothetical protein
VYVVTHGLMAAEIMINLNTNMILNMLLKSKNAKTPVSIAHRLSLSASFTPERHALRGQHCMPPRDHE